MAKTYKRKRVKSDDTLNNSPTKKYKKTRRSSKKGSKSTYRKKTTLNSKPKKVGTSHWLSHGTWGKIKGAKFNRKWLKGKIKVDPSRTWVDSYGANIVVAAGVQGVANLYGINTPYDFYIMQTSATNRLLVESVSVSASFTNQSNTPTFIDLYDIEARDDTTYLETALTTPLAAFDNGSGGAGQYGMTPFESDLFTQTYKITRITRYNLAAGETASHMTSIKPKCVFTKTQDLAYNNGAAKNVGNFGGWTKWCMAVVKGCAADADNNTVGPAACKIDYLIEKRYRFQVIVPDSTPVYAGALSSAATHIMETDGDDAVINTA